MSHQIENISKEIESTKMHKTEILVPNAKESGNMKISQLRLSSLWQGKRKE